MIENIPSTVIDYEPVPQKKARPKRHSFGVVVSLLLYLCAVLVWSLVELYGFVSFNAYNRQTQIYENLIRWYPIDPLMFWILVIGMIAAVVGLLHPKRIRWAAILALIFNVVVFLLNYEAVMGVHYVRE